MTYDWIAYGKKSNLKDGDKIPNVEKENTPLVSTFLRPNAETQNCASDRDSETHLFGPNVKKENLRLFKYSLFLFLFPFSPSFCKIVKKTNH